MDPAKLLRISKSYMVRGKKSRRGNYSLKNPWFLPVIMGSLFLEDQFPFCQKIIYFEIRPKVIYKNADLVLPFLFRMFHVLR